MKNNYKIFALCLLIMAGGLSFATNAHYQTPIKHKLSKLFAPKQQDTCLFSNPIADLPWLSTIFANIEICGCSYPNGVSQYTIDGQPAFILQQYYTCEVPPPSIQNVYSCDGSVICQLDTSPTADPNAQPCQLGELVNTWQLNPNPLNTLPWLANIANNANGCAVAQIVDLGVYYGNEMNYWGQHLFATAPGMGLLCPTDLPLVVYNCSGQQVCFNGFMPANAPELCANVLPDLDISNGTLIWEYQATSTNLCDLVDLIPPADSIVQNIIAEYPCDVCGWQLDWYCNNGQTLLQVSSVPYTLPDGTMIVCSDIPTYYYDTAGNQICYTGGLIGGTCTDTSGIDFENLVFQETLWSCSDNNPPPTCVPDTYGTIVEHCGVRMIELNDSTYWVLENVSNDNLPLGHEIYFSAHQSDILLPCEEISVAAYYIADCYEVLSLPETWWDIIACTNSSYTQNLSYGGYNVGISVTNQALNGIASINLDSLNNIILTYTPNANFVGSDEFMLTTAEGINIVILTTVNYCDILPACLAPADSVVQNLAAQIDCSICTQNLDLYCDGTNSIIVFTSTGICADFPIYYYDLNGNQICTESGYPPPGYVSPCDGLINFGNLNFVQNLWSCNTGGCVCPEIYAPVCGPDGQVYSNSCFAECEGVYDWTNCNTSQPDTITWGITVCNNQPYTQNLGYFGDEEGASITTQPTNGTATINFDAQFSQVLTYTPNAGFTGNDTFVVTASGFDVSTGQSYTISITQYIVLVNDCGGCTAPADTIVQNLAAQISCDCSHSIDLYCDGNNAVMVVSGGFPCLDYPTRYYDAMGNYLCQSGGLMLPTCDGLVDLNNLVFVQNLAGCAAPCLCPEYYQPVCGSDGITYDNSCFAECAGVSWTDGACNPTPTDTLYQATYNYTICPGDSIAIGFTDNFMIGNTIYNWSPDAGQLSCYNPQCRAIWVAPTQNTSYVLDVFTTIGMTHEYYQYNISIDANCDTTTLPCGVALSSLEWLNNLIAQGNAQDPNDCSALLGIYTGTFNGQTVIYAQYNSACDAPSFIYSCDGTIICSFGGLIPIEDCDTPSNLSPIWTQSVNCNCPDIYAPVCGADGQTYGNSCEADCAGVPWTDGACNPSPTDTTYFNYTICLGDSILIGFADGMMIGNTTYNWSPNDGQLSCFDSQCRAIWVAPSQNTTYVLDVFTTIGMTHEYYQYNISIDANCDTTTLPCGVALNSLEWLNNLIAQGNAQDPNDCSALLGIYTGTFNGQTVIYAQYNSACDAPSFIYSCNGTIICSFGGLMPVEDCDTPSNLSPIWTQSVNCNCPDIYAPVCGADGQTYGNSCEADCAGVVWTEGACGETPPLCNHPDTMYVCTPPITTINLCPEFCFEGDYTITATPQYFSCSINIEDNCVEYTPVPLFYGNEIVTIIGCQGSLCDTIYYNIFTGICNQPPVALNDTVWIEGATATPIYVLNNDFDAEGNTFSISTHTQAQNGTLTLNNNSFVYTPNAGFEGTDTFEYQICDEDGLCDAAVVTVYVSNNVVPICENEVIHICTQPIMPEWICPEFCNLAGTDVAITDVISQFSCSVYLPANSSCVRYTALPLFSGTDTLQIIACNALGMCDTVMALMHVGECPDGEGGKYTNNGIEQSLELHSLSPVPASSDLFVRFTTQQTQAQISIIDLNGRTIEQLQLTTISGSPQVQRIEVGHYPAGMYLLSIQTTEGRITQPWIKQ